MYFVELSEPQQRWNRIGKSNYQESERFFRKKQNRAGPPRAFGETNFHFFPVQRNKISALFW